MLLTDTSRAVGGDVDAASRLVDRGRRGVVADALDDQERAALRVEVVGFGLGERAATLGFDGGWRASKTWAAHRLVNRVGLGVGEFVRFCPQPLGHPGEGYVRVYRVAAAASLTPVIPLLMIMIPLLAVVVALFVSPVVALSVVLVLFVIFVVLAGKRITTVWFGALIDERNMTSLSRFQTALWTVLVVSAILVAAFRNIHSGDSDPLDIVVPPELWLLLGISVTSLVGSGLIKQEQAKVVPNGAAAVSELSRATSVNAAAIVPVVGNRIEDQSGPGAPAVMAKGVLKVNDRAGQASWLDMFRAEDISGIGRLDLGKVQMFFFTIVIVVSYGAAVFALFSMGTAKIDHLPVLNASAIALLGISHAAYLANKAALRTVTTTP